ncbi:alpha/beta hydrolase [Streptomyces sp. KR80]|uniref:alpha/beta hydrolase n=1 Tax=Streptomyces sp. KR80 TaxID=3457426 RepID=UPI003FD0D4BC
MTADRGGDRGIVYGGGGKLMDVYRAAEVQAAAPAVLLWHGSGPDERDVLEPLARTVAGLGASVFVPDWRPDAHDGGHEHLLESVEFVRKNATAFGADADKIVLAGWSLGGRVAMRWVMRPEAVGGWTPMAVVGIAAAYESGPRWTGSGPLDDLATGTVYPVPVRLVHGTADTAVDIRHSREFCAALEHQGWPVTMAEPDADHAEVVMTEYDPEQGRCRPARTERALRAGRLTARVLAAAGGIVLRHGGPGLRS